MAPLDMNTVLKNYLSDLEQYGTQQRWDKVISACQALMDHASQQIECLDDAGLTSQDESDESEQYRLKGNLLASQTDLEGAIAAYQEAIRLNPDHVDAYVALADLYAQEKDGPKAADWYQQALQASPSLTTAYRLLAVLEHSSQKKTAASLLYDVFNTAPQTVEAKAFFKLGNVLSQQGQIEQAITCYQGAIACNPQRADFHFTLGTAFAQTNDWTSALAAYKQTLKCNPQSARAHYALGECHLRKSHPDKALKHFKSAVEINPNLASGHAKLGHIWHQQGKIKRAIHACLEALKQQPNLSEPFVKLRYNLLRYDVGPNSPLLDDVIETCETILQQEPNSIPIQSLLGYTLTRQRNYNEAIQCYKRASAQKAQKAKPNLDKDGWQNESQTPSFIIIGAFKCATTSVYQYINRHPNVLPSLEKELDFFDLQFKNGLDWYLSHFPPAHADEQIITGEATPNYFYNVDAPERIAKHLPDVKLILTFRNPIARTVSHYNFIQRNIQNPKPIEEVLERELKNLSELDETVTPDWEKINQNPYIGHSLYGYYLKHWLEYFDSKQLLILKHETLAENPEQTLSSVFNHLGLSDYSLPEYKKYKLGQYSPISQAMQEKLSNFFRPHTMAMESLLNHTFAWDGMSQGTENI